MAPQPPGLPDMPTELQVQIASYLQFPDAFNLRNSCKTFQRKLPAPTVEELLGIEQLDILPNFYQNIFACVMCLRLRPREKFADNSRVRKKGKDGELRHRRYCVDCGRNPYECTTTDGKRVSVTMYSPGSLLFIMGEKFVVCIRCGKFGRGEKKCFKRDGFNLTTPAGRCNDCPEEFYGERESLYCINAADRLSAEVWWDAQTRQGRIGVA